MIHQIKCEFNDARKEERYRTTEFESSKFQSKIGLIVMGLTVLLFIRTDSVYISDPLNVEEVLYLRLFYAFITFLILFIYSKAKIYQMADILMLVWALFTAVTITFINATRHSEFMYHHITDILIIMSFYVFFSNRLIYQFIPAALFSLANIIIFNNLEVITVLEVNTVAFAHFAANFIGIYTSYKNHKYRRIMHQTLIEKEDYHDYT